MPQGEDEAEHEISCQEPTWPLNLKAEEALYCNYKMELTLSRLVYKKGYILSVATCQRRAKAQKKHVGGWVSGIYPDIYNLVTLPF